MWKRLILALAAAAVLGGAFAAYESHTLASAHSTFENYYAFRGCVELLDRTDSYGDCRLENGSTIRLVKFDNRWFLDGDLPQCALSLGSWCAFNWP